MSLIEISDTCIDVYDANYAFFRNKMASAGSSKYQIKLLGWALLGIAIPLRLPPFSKILDVGCSIGDLAMSLNRLTYRTYGVDLNLAALKFGQNQLGVNRIAVANAQFLPFRQQAFDAVVTQDIFEHMPDEKSANTMFEEVSRVCKGNRMFHKITVTEDKDNINQDPTHHLKWSANKWGEWFEEKGWKVIAPTTYIYPHKPGKKSSSTIHGYFLLKKA